ncbi:MAG: hypothetical protein M5U34_34250 [Chloroflexi bacterium]|nr:hypothetical protein [Chloroflexota bacterium]
MGQWFPDVQADPIETATRIWLSWSSIISALAPGKLTERMCGQTAVS